MLFFGLLAREFNGVDLLFSDVVVTVNINGYALVQQAVEIQPGLELLREN